ncbi:ThuA domain-containing protein [Paenibacillus algorifonticola]|uniref:ThuA domain-containing protein n=1 Tax=Paenibacillus algorifonticola TaxID=684063 RepID=UPI003D2BCF42
MRTILAVIGDYYHPAEAIAEGLQQSLAPLMVSGDIELSYTTVKYLAEELAAKPDAVILYKDNNVNPADEQVQQWLGDETEQAILQYVRAGGGWFAWHSGLASYPSEGGYAQMTRGYFQHHPEQKLVRSLTVEPAGRSGEEHVHIAADQAFETVDEHYFVHCEEASTTVFMRTYSEDGQSIGGWSHAYGEGRVCCLTPAHNRESLLHPVLGELVNACVQWCARMA